jgi:hypothetical protein
MQPRCANDSERDAPVHAAPRAFVERRRWLSRAVGSAAALLAPIGTGRCLAGEPSSKWPYEVSAGQFRIHADFDVSASDQLLGELDRLSGDVKKLLELELPTKSMHIVLFSGQEEYRRYMAHYYPALPERRALFIQQRGTSMLFAHRHPELATDLRHEATHALLNEGSNPLPLWLDEGLAEYFEVPEAQRWSGHTHLPAIRGLVGKAMWRDLETLEALRDVADMSGEHYRDSGAWVHFLVHRRPATRRLLIENLASLRAAQPMVPLSRTIAMQLPEWRREFDEHFHRLA